MNALAALGAILLFITACGFVAIAGWLIFKLAEHRTHRKAIDQRLSDVANGDCFPHVPAVNDLCHFGTNTRKGQ